MQIPGFLSKQVRPKALQILKRCDENTIAKLVFNIWRNFSNRFCQSTFPEFNAFSNFNIALIFWKICKQFAYLSAIRNKLAKF